MMKHYDVVISGAGMVGASIAAALQAQKISTLLIEAQSLEALRCQEDYGLRVSAFTPSSKKWLQHVGAWDHITHSARVAPFMHMHVWDASGKGNLTFNAHDANIDALGHIIDNAAVQEALLTKLESAIQSNTSSVDLLAENQITAFTRNIDDSGITIALADGKQITAKLLIGADGGNSKIRQLAGIACSGWSYGQKTIVGQVRPEKSHENTCWQRFLSNGPIALLPLADGRCSLAWHTTHEEADQLLALSKEDFSKQMSAQFEFKFGTIEVAGELGAFPLKLNHARDYIKPNIALVGDAIHTIHPLAGLGVNLGFLDAATLVDEIIHAKNKGQSLCNIQILKSYQRKRKAHNLLIMGAMDVFKRSSTSNNPLLIWGRNQGLSITDRILPLKNNLAKVAMGYYGCLPNSIKV